jgi:hypothetical protein
MNVAKVNVRWAEPPTAQRIAITVVHPGLFVRVGVEPSERRCPFCNSIVYTRRHKRCGACDGVLPDSCLFSSAEAEKVDALLRTERQRHRDWLRKAAA